MFKIVSYETFQDGQIIFEEGSNGDWIYVVEEGECVFRLKPPPDSDSFRHLNPLQVATQFRLIPPWESDPFRHPLE